MRAIKTPAYYCVTRISGTIFSKRNRFSLDPSFAFKLGTCFKWPVNAGIL